MHDGSLVSLSMTLGSPHEISRHRFAFSNAVAEGYAGQFLRFHQALEAGTALPVTLQDARDSLELVTAMYRSARTGQAVQLPIRSSDADYQSWLP